MFFKDLSKKEKKHLREQGVRTLAEFKETAEKQRVLRKHGGEPCFECKNIARKLGLPVEPGRES